MIHDLFSKRQKRLRGEVPDVYTFDSVPEVLRIQLVQMLDEHLGDLGTYHNDHLARDSYERLVKSLRKEYGVFVLPPTDESSMYDYYNECTNFIVGEPDVGRVLDIVELSARLLVDRQRDGLTPGRTAYDFIVELNGRFREAGVGYEYRKGQVVRVDSELLHSEAVKPALTLLHNKEYAGAQEEFLSALDHYRHSNCKEALNESLKAFESVMKCICSKRKWKYTNNDTSKRLISICFDNGLIPDFWQSHFASLRSLLESGVPTARNNISGHGQGTTPVEAPEYLVAYALHMTASAIVFLVEAEKALK